MSMRIRVGVVGGTGYTGAELLRVLWSHPEVEVTLVTSTRQAGVPVAALYPALEELGLVYETLDAQAARECCDGFFVCTPHGAAMGIVPELFDGDHWVVDLSADFRLADAKAYAAVYGREHESPELLAEAAYGLTELFREDVARARLVANPGCYPTAALLALAPVLAEGLVAGGSIVVDAKSGVSGAGREPSTSAMFSEASESMSAYKVACHRHQPEMEEAAARIAGEALTITFTPHLAPMVRGILATCYATLVRPAGLKDVARLYKAWYAAEPFVTVLEEGRMPSTKEVSGSNACHIGLAVDERASRLVVVSAIDNLVKGASGQAVQNMNVMLGLDEMAGLTALGRVV